MNTEKQLIDCLKCWAKECNYSYKRITDDNLLNVSINSLGLDELDELEIIMEIEEITDHLLPDGFIFDHSELSVKEFVDLVLFESL